MSHQTTHGELLVRTVVNGPFMENCYVVADRASQRALVIDPGLDDQLVLEQVRDMGVEVERIVCTHTHIDHAGNVAPLKRALGAPLSVHADEVPALSVIGQQAMMFGLPKVETPKVDTTLDHGDTVTVGQRSARVLATPGHSAGDICLLFEAEGVVFVGDTLFAGSVGRVDLPGGNGKTLLASIRDQLMTLDDAVVVYSGHGEVTTIGAERQSNPYLQPGAEMFF